VAICPWGESKAFRPIDAIYVGHALTGGRMEMTPFEDDYKAFLKNLNVGRLRVALVSTIILAPIFTVLDYVIYPEAIKMFLPLRFACFVLSAIVFALSYTEKGVLYVKILEIFTLSNISIMVAFTIQYLGYETPYYAGLNLIILAIGVILPWDVYETLAASGIIYVSYLLPTLLLSDIGNIHIFLNNNVFILGTIMVVGTGSYFTSSLRKREFIARFQLEQARMELEEALAEVKRVGCDLIHSEKMSALGVMMAGIAHEINNPVSFAKGSLVVVKNAFEKIKHGRMQSLQEAEISLDIVNEGLERAEAIVKNLSSFIRKDDQWTAVNLQESLESTLHLLYHEIKQRIEFCCDYTEVAPIEANPGQINQAFMNILLNAIQAIEGTGKIWITIRSENGEVRISIRDNGIGIPAACIDKIFDPFFTTKEIGKGTGLGMAITHKIIVENHRGKIDVKSHVGSGTEMIITLPLTQPKHPDRYRL